MEQTWLELSFRLQPYLFHLLNFLTYYPYAYRVKSASSGNLLKA